MKNVPLLLGTILGSIVLILVIGFLFSKSGQPSTEAVADRSQLESDLTKVQGATSSAVMVVEFSDFQCPACKSVAPLVEDLAAQYKDKAQFAYRHFPLIQIHPNARPSAIAAEAAAVQGAFWPYHDLLFARQEEWAEIEDEKALSEKFVSYAAELKLNTEQFSKDMADPAVAQVVDDDTAVGNSVNVNATPTFFVNGKPTATTDLETAIEQELAVVQPQ